MKILVLSLAATTMLVPAAHAASTAVVQPGHGSLASVDAAQFKRGGKNWRGNQSGGGEAQGQGHGRWSDGNKGGHQGNQSGWQHQPKPQPKWQGRDRDDDRGGWNRDDDRGGWSRDDRDGKGWGRNDRDNWRKDDWRNDRDNWRDKDRNDYRGDDWRDRDRHDYRGDDWRGKDWDRDDRKGKDRWDRHDRDNYRWDNGWRKDRRYDWRGHRDRYRDHYRGGRYYPPVRHHRYSRFSIGFHIGSGFYHQNYWLNDPWAYRLPPVHGPYRWVRYYDDVLLVDIRNGYVVDVIYDFFW